MNKIILTNSVCGALEVLALFRNPAASATCILVGVFSEWANRLTDDGWAENFNDKCRLCAEDEKDPVEIVIEFIRSLIKESGATTALAADLDPLEDEADDAKEFELVLLDKPPGVRWAIGVPVPVELLGLQFGILARPRPRPFPVEDI
uniref:Uncharacterized protein n=1 Tax=Romanomermis culicivorax TaxID=13658 RepID=A0A915JMM9_ROMCU